jgi:SAM-dependent methyltransferase
VTHADATARARFRAAYGAHRAAEGRAHDRAALRALPYLSWGPLARQWGVRARSFDAFVARVLRPMTRATTRATTRARPVQLLDLGAGSGWLCRRAALAGCAATAVDIRADAVDGLGAAACVLGEGEPGFHRVAASFDALPFGAARFDLVVFNAAIHYALDLGDTLREARRVTAPGGRLVILDSPFYARAADGEAMVAEKHREGSARFGERAAPLLALPFVEYLTRDRLADASRGLGLAWRRHRVRYPLWYELRPVVAWLRGRRAPSRFDLWESTVA